MLLHVDQAEEEIYLLVTTGDLLEQDMLEALVEANERGVTIFAEVPEKAARTRLHDTIPDCRVAITDLHLDPITDEYRTPGRLMMVDQDTVP